MVDAILGALLPTYTAFGPDEQERFRTYCLDRVGGGRAGNDSLAELLAFVRLDVVVLDSRSGRIERTDTVRAPSAPPPAAPAAKPDAKPDAGEVDGRTRALNRRFAKERRKQESKSRLRAFLRTGIRADINKVESCARMSLDDVSALRDESAAGMPWSQLSAWHRRRVLEAYLRGEGEGGEGEDDPRYAREVAEALSGTDSTHALNRLAAPEYDHATGEVRRLVRASESEAAKKKRGRPKKPRAPAAADNSSAGKAAKKTRRTKKEAPAAAENGGCAFLLKQCRAVRRRQVEARARSVRFTGKFVSTN